MTVKTKYVILLAFALILMIFGSGWWLGRTNGNRASQASISTLNGQINQYIIELGDIQKYVTEKEQEILTLRQAKQEGLVTNEALRKLSVRQLNEITRLKLRIDTLLTNVIHNGEVVEILDSQITNYKSENDSIKKRKAILLPFSFNRTDKWLNLNGTFNNMGKLDMSLKINIEADVYSVIKKDTKKSMVIITTDNPYVGVIDIRSQKFDVPKIKRYGIGVIGGYGIGFGTPLRTAPFVGMGLSYNLIRF